MKNDVAYKAWVETHTPQAIYDANLARKQLKRKYDFPKASLKLIRDERVPKQPPNAFALFVKARWASGEYSTKNDPITAITSKITNEWKGLSEAERQVREFLRQLYIYIYIYLVSLTFF